MTFKHAWSLVALAGREMGSGIAVAGIRIADAAQVDLTGINEANVDAIKIGIAVGLVMAEEPEALAELKQINAEWMRDR